MDVDDFLEHYGRKGMRWGVRTKRKLDSIPRNPQSVIVKDRPGRPLKTSGGKNRLASDDARSHAAKIQIAKKSGAKSLSDKELKDLLTRIGNEKKLKDVLPKSKSKQAVKLVSKLLHEQGQREIKELKAGKVGPLMTALSGTKLAKTIGAVGA